MKQILFYSLMLIFVTACVPAPIRSLSDDDKLWTGSYNEGDTVLFVSSGDVDTFMVEMSACKQYYLPFVNWNIGGDLEEFVMVTGRMVHRHKHFECALVAERKKEDRLNLLLRFSDRFMDDTDGRKVKFNEILFQGDSLKDVLFVNRHNSHLANTDRVSSIDCVYFVWSKTRGLLQYKYNTGETYVFYKKLRSSRR